MRVASLSCLVIAIVTCTVSGQDPDVSPPTTEWVPYVHSTGTLNNTSNEGDIVDVHVIQLPARPSLRLVFDQVNLGPNDWIEVFSPITEYSHKLDNAELAKFTNSTVYFSGDTLVVSTYLEAGSTGSWSMTQLIAGLFTLDGIDTICFTIDDRVPSSDPRVARFQSSPTSNGGCTIWMAGPDDCAISAGHCFSGGSLMLAEFNPPFSDPVTGTNLHAPPEDQYPVDAATIVFVNGGTGNDWGVCKLLPNNLGQSASVNQGYFYMSPYIPAVGEPVRITGHGTASPPQENQVQQTHVGPSFGNTGTALHYTTDTTGGNSGSPVICDTSGAAIGVHTHGGCGANGGGNTGTSFSEAAFMAAYIACCQTTPVADFTSDFTMTLPGNTVQFFDRTGGVPTSWAWDLDGDGSTDSTAQNPSFTYAAPGSYDVSLSATNTFGTDVLTVTGYITVNVPDTGQPNSAAASMDIAGALDTYGGEPQPGQNGPFFVSLGAGDALDIAVSGPPNQDFLIVVGPLNRANDSFPGLGQLDVGLLGPGNYADIAIAVDGLSGTSFLDGLANTGPNGSQTFSFTLPVLPPGVLDALQAVVTQPAGTPVLSAATEITAM